MTRIIRGAPPVTMTINATQERGCSHYNALTCIAEQEHTSRFNAMIVFANGDENGGCSCPCHHDAYHRPVSATTWQRIYAEEQAQEARRSQREARRAA